MNSLKYRFVVFIMVLFSAGCSLWAQGGSFYLQQAKRYLDNSDCIRAAIYYNVYQELTNGSDLEVERRIQSCSSGTIKPSAEDLFGEELQQVDEEILAKVKLFQRYVNNLAGNSFTHSQKEQRYQLAMNLFINRGEPYDIIVPSEEGDVVQKHEAVKMCVITSKRTQVRKNYPMKQYLRTLIRNSENPNYRYQKVVIEGSDVIKIDNYRKVGDGQYMALAHYVQKFSAYQSAEMGRASYNDYTRKTIAIYINIFEIDQPDGSTRNYIQVLLGDVDCEGQAW